MAWDKVEMKAYVSKGLNQRFRELINEKHGGFMRGLLSYEVEQALSQYIASYHSTHAHDTQPIKQYPKQNPIPSIHKLAQDIKRFLVDRSYFASVSDISCIPQAFLVESITALKGSDHRTLRKYIDLLTKYGSIKQLGDFQWEIV